jgi:hypothetical protein
MYHIKITIYQMTTLVRLIDASVPTSFTDHLVLIVSVSVPRHGSRGSVACPNSRNTLTCGKSTPKSDLLLEHFTQFPSAQSVKSQGSFVGGPIAKPTMPDRRPVSTVHIPNDCHDYARMLIYTRLPGFLQEHSQLIG